MLTNPSTGRRLAGRVIVVAAIAVAVPLTATRAIEYVDIAVPAAASAPQAAKAPAAPAAVAALAVQATAPDAPVQPRSNLSINDDMITFDGQTKRWEEMTPAEKARVRAELAQAREELKRVNTEEIRREVREAMAQTKIDKEEIRREMASARREIDEAMRDIDANAAEIRRAGQDPEQIKEIVRASLKSVEAMDLEAITRQAMASVEPAVVNSALAAAEAGLRQAQAELDRLDARTRED